MILKDYVIRLHELVRTHPEAKMMQVVYGKDDEGNSFQPVTFNPSIGYFDADSNDFRNDRDGEQNAVCLN